MSVDGENYNPAHYDCQNSKPLHIDLRFFLTWIRVLIIIRIVWLQSCSGFLGASPSDPYKVWRVSRFCPFLQRSIAAGTAARVSGSATW